MLVLEDEVAALFSHQQNLRSLYFKSLGLYAEYGAVLVSDLPIFVLPTGKAYGGQREGLRMIRPDTDFGHTDIFDEFVIIAYGLSQDRYTNDDKQIFEDMSVYVLQALERSNSLLQEHQGARPVNRKQLM